MVTSGIVISSCMRRLTVGDTYKVIIADKTIRVNVWENADIFVNDKGYLHNDNGPAMVSYDSARNHTIVVAYYRNGLMHNVNGPAMISLFSEESIYSINGVPFTKEEFARITSSVDKSNIEDIAEIDKYLS